MELELRGINKKFGDKQILHDVSFSIKSGKAMGFLGRNGAGKTTTIRSLMGVFKQDSGEFLLDGKPFAAKAFKVGYLPEERGMYDKIGIAEQLSYFGKLKGMTTKAAKQATRNWLERFELEAYEKKKLEVLSKGNQQKIQIIQALINDPDIVILDEPFSGLDPVNAQFLKEIIREYIKLEKLVIFSSHQMGYVEEFCDEITFIDQGHVILNGELKTIKKELGEAKIRLKISGMDRATCRTKIASLEGIEVTEDQKSIIIKLLEPKRKKDLLLELLQQDLVPELFALYEPTLEEIFIAKVGG